MRKNPFSFCPRMRKASFTAMLNESFLSGAFSKKFSAVKAAILPLPAFCNSPKLRQTVNPAASRLSGLTNLPRPPAMKSSRESYKSFAIASDMPRSGWWA